MSIPYVQKPKTYSHLHRYTMYNWDLIVTEVIRQAVKECTDVVRAYDNDNDFNNKTQYNEAKGILNDIKRLRPEFVI